jgi:YVTN family beta-propeller protein
MRSYLPSVASAVAVAVLAACIDAGPAVPASVSVSPDSVQLVVGQTQQVVGVALDAAGRQMAAVPLSFTSSNSGVAAVTQGGLVSAEAVGVATITAAAGPVEKAIPAVVIGAGLPQLPTLSVFPDSVTIPQLGSQQLSYALRDSAGLVVPGTVYAFTSQHPAMVRITSGGLVTSLGPAGVFSVTIAAAGDAEVVPVVVFQVTGGVDLLEENITLRQGESMPVSATVVDLVGTVIVGAPVAFSSDNTTIATVNGAGVITGRQPGTTVVRAGNATFTDQVTVTVKDSAIIATTPLTGRGFGVAIAASGAAYVTQPDQGAVARVSLPDPDVVTVVPVGTIPGSVAFTPDGATAFVANILGGSVSVIEVGTNTNTGTIGLPANPLIVGLSPDGSRLWATADNGKVYVIDPGTGTAVDSVQVGNFPNGLAFHPSSPLVYVSNAVSGSVAEISSTAHTVVRTFAVGGAPQGIAVALDGSELYIANENAGIQIWNLTTGLSAGEVAGTGGLMFGAALSPDGTWLAVTQTSGRLVLVNPVTRTVGKTVVTHGTPRRVAFTADGATLVVANEGGWFDVIRR